MSAVGVTPPTHTGAPQQVQEDGCSGGRGKPGGRSRENSEPGQPTPPPCEPTTIPPIHVYRGYISEPWPIIVDSNSSCSVTVAIKAS